jgi:putative toxin-antitoxin system antitoxin component (TIGR02293 family)
MGKPKKRRYLRQAVLRERPTAGYGTKSPLAKKQIAPAKVIRQISKGLPFSELEHLQSEVAEPLGLLARQLSISRSTLQRRKAERHLSPAESERVIRFRRILQYATKLFGTVERARQWLKFPQFGLGGAVPLEFAKTEMGAREVEDLLGRIDYGVYS